ncbi:MAG: hypothetical protein V3T05_01840 [Myxococcota bacterium]
MGVLGSLQTVIEELHDVETELDVGSFVVNEATRSAIPGACHGLLEQLFVREDDDGMELALYIDPKILQCLEVNDPRLKLHAGNFEAYCIALEGVSHFVFLTWRAQLGRPVTALELEIQAEVDKFVTAWLLLARQGGRRLHEIAPTLSRRLFDDYDVREAVPADEVSRYHVANRAARRYCRDLAARFGRDRHERRIRADVRAFYRRGLSEKLQAA